MAAAGFTDIEITWRADVFSGAPQATSAAAFGTQGINFRARKAPMHPEAASQAADQRSGLAAASAATDLR